MSQQAKGGKNGQSQKGRAKRADTTELRARHGWDLLFGVGLTGVALVGWSSTFDGLGFWFAGGLATVTAAWLAQLAVALGGRLFSVCLTLLAGLYLLSGPVAMGVDVINRPKEMFWQGPQAAVDCWAIVLSTHPPLAATGPVLMAPFLLCWFSAGLGVGIGVCSSRPAAPLTPPLLVFLAVLLLAQPEPVAASLQGMAFGGGALMWLRIRSLRVEAERHGQDPAWRARVVAGTALVLVGAGLTWLIVRDAPADADRLVLRQQLAPYDAARLTTPLDEFRTFTQPWKNKPGNVANEQLFEVTGAPKGTRLRFAVLDDYTGDHWVAGNDTDPTRTDDRFLRISDHVDNPADGDEVDVEVKPTEAWARHGASHWLPTLGAVQSLEFVEPARAEATEGLRFNPATGSAVLVDRLEADDDYRLSTRVTTDRLSPKLTPSTALDESLYDEAAFVDPVIDAWAPPEATPMKQLFAIAAQLKRFGRYSDGVGSGQSVYTAGHDVERLGLEFLLADPTVGNDEQYAATLALVANRLRIPARVVVGVPVTDKLAKRGVVRGRHVEAWIEVRVEDGSWRTLNPQEFMSHRPPEQQPVKGQLPPRKFPDPPKQEEPDRQEKRQEKKEKEPKDKERDRTKQEQDSAGPWWRWLLLLPLSVLLIPLAKTIRRRRRRHASRASRRYAGAWSELTDRARDLGRPVPAGLTRPAQATLLDVPTELATDADVVIFAATEPGDDGVGDYWSRVDEARREVARSRPRWRRATAWLNPASLRRRR